MDIEGLLKSLNAHSVRYVVIGATAFPVHGYARATLDIDLFIEPTPENAARTREALVAFGYDMTDVGVDEMLVKKILIRQYMLETDLHPFVRGVRLRRESRCRRPARVLRDRRASRRGGMGEVYRARDTRLGREVAIKVLRAERLSDPVRRARFEQEARSAAALHHPNIVTIYEIESAEGVDFIVMELVAGKTLDALIPRQGMRLGEALRIAIPLADALAAAHDAGIVHCDLKPANVMVTPEGAAKVLDFGLARLTLAEPSSSEDDTTLDARPSGNHGGLLHPGRAVVRLQLPPVLVWALPARRAEVVGPPLLPC